MLILNQTNTFLRKCLSIQYSYALIHISTPVSKQGNQTLHTLLSKKVEIKLFSALVQNTVHESTVKEINYVLPSIR